MNFSPPAPSACAEENLWPSARRISYLVCHYLASRRVCITYTSGVQLEKMVNRVD
jgi:hypothetical protein